MRQQEFPLTIKSVVTIYHTPKGEYDGYTLSWREGDKRKRRIFADLARAKKEAGSIADKINHGENAALSLTNADRSAYVTACDFVDPTGVPLELAAKQYAEIHRILGGRDPVEAARYYAKKHPIDMASKTVAEVAAEFLDAKTKAKKSNDYLVDCRYRHGKFAEAFQCNIGAVTGEQINEFLDDLDLSIRSRNNFRLSIGTLYEFAKLKRYVPLDWDGMSHVEKVRDESEGEITIYSPDEMQAFLDRSRPELVPFLAIGAFAGLRSAEIERLTWADVFEKPGKIEVKAKKAKTRARRLVPIQPNLAKWLAPFEKHDRAAKVVKFADIGLQIRELCEADKGKDLKALTWKRNALRHSFISYRLAEVQSAAQVALEAGNSETMIFKNYRDVVTPESAKAWFSIEP
jgi:integrase